MSRRKEILYLGNKLAKHGFSLSTIETLGPLLEQEGFPVLYASDKKNAGLRLLDMLFSIIAHRKSIGIVLIDTYSTNAFYFAWSSAMLCRLLRIKYMPILHGGNLPARIKRSPMLTKQLFGHSLTNVVISGYLQKSMEENGFSYQLIPNNIDIGQYHFLHRMKAGPKLLWVRAFHSIYNPQLALQVVAALSSKYPDVSLTMVGPDKDGSLELCKSLCAELGLADKVTFTGKVSKEEWRAISMKHDIFINTTNFDNLPVSVIEAMALGMPIVSTNAGGLPYLIKDGENGLLVSVNNANEMVAAISRVINDASVPGRLSKNARKTAEFYDWNVIKILWKNLISNYIGS